MSLFTLCINPLIYRLEHQLRGIVVNRRQRKTAVVVYADDDTVLVSTAEEIAALYEGIRCYEETIFANLNIAKSHAMSLGS